MANIQIHYLQKLHAEILDIMDEVDRVCKKNNLRYYIVGGTLLGAIRHKGFIPWDDDLDIAMPRDDFERFIELSSSELNPSYYLEWITTNPIYWESFPKVCRKDTVFLHQTHQKRNLHWGIFIDIFPLDYSPAYSNKLEWRKKLGNHLKALLVSAVIEEKNTWKIWVYRFIHLFISNKYVHKLIRSVRLSARKLGATHFANFGSQYKLSKQTMPIEWYGEGTPIEFEGRMYNAPKEYERVLSSIYGNNYMQLPPENKRRTHYPIKVVFSDGETMEFKRTENVVKAEE